MPSGEKKKAGVLCPYYKDGCSIHENKPRPCRQYRCYWLELFEDGKITTTEWRPNEVGFSVSRRPKFMFIDGEASDGHPLLKYIQEQEGDVKFVRR